MFQFVFGNRCLIQGHIVNLVTSDASEVSVLIGRCVVSCCCPTEGNRFHKPNIYQRFHRLVDGRNTHPGKRIFDARVNVVYRRVGLVSVEKCVDGKPLPGYSVTGPSQALARSFYWRVCGLQVAQMTLKVKGTKIGVR